VTLIAAVAAGALATAFWVVGRDAALRRALAPGSVPWIALVTALLVGGTSVEAPALAAVCGALVAGTIDARTGAIPDPLSAATALTALGFAAVEAAVVPAIGGALLAGGALLGLHLVTGGRGLGLGDVKLGAAIGAGFGPAAGISAIAYAFVLGGVFAVWLLVMRRARRGAELRFGPFLAAGACAAALLPSGFPL
jgi:leader peptidase (prepilin peptidase)/N-methyltransferase